MTVNDFLAGSVAGAAGIFFGYPLDTVKTRLQTSSSYSGIIQCVGKVLKTEGVLGMYKGVTAPCLFAGIQHSLLFAGYATTLHLMHPGEAHVEARKDLPLAGSTLAVGREILAAEGWRAFYKGGLSMVLRGFPVNAIIFLVYEQCLLFMERDNTSQLQLPGEGYSLTQ
ncbi:unnamed protein product, partial [Mesorhabditis spiculigera]